MKNMSYFLYLKQSFRRRPMWHLNIYVIITCALILPLLFSIYLDSSSYGWSQQLISMAKGETFHIANAGEKDVEVFRNIEGLSEPYWEDGTVYVHILDDEQWKNTETMQYFGSLLQKDCKPQTIRCCILPHMIMIPPTEFPMMHRKRADR